MIPPMLRLNSNMETLINVDPVDSYAFSEFICPICQSLARTVHQAGCCGTLFCKSCIEGWKTESSHFTCPMCRTSLYNNYFEDKNAARRIRETIVFCPNHRSASSGKRKRCQWTGEFTSVDDHLAVCDYQVIPCPNNVVLKQNDSAWKSTKNVIAFIEKSVAFIAGIGISSWISSVTTISAQSFL